MSDTPQHNWMIIYRRNETPVRQAHVGGFAALPLPVTRSRNVRSGGRLGVEMLAYPDNVQHDALLHLRLGPCLPALVQLAVAVIATSKVLAGLGVPAPAPLDR
jgi:hypothetical protein